MHQSQSEFEKGLNELYDIRLRKERLRRENEENAMIVKKEIKLLTLMFSDGIKDISLPLDENEVLEWDSRSRRLIYHKGEVSRFIETVSNDLLIKIRPFLKMMVSQVRESYV